MRAFVPQFLEHLESAAAGHGHIQDHQVPSLLLDQGERLLAILRFAQDGELSILRHNLLQPAPENRVVIDDQDFDHSFSPLAPDLPSGILTVTVVPTSATPRIWISPPKGRTRSRMPSSPKDFALAISSGVIPRPLSRTSRMRSAASSRKSTWIRLACAWRATLVSAS